MSLRPTARPSAVLLVSSSLLVLVLVVGVVRAGPSSGQARDVRYRPPVPGPVVEHFDLPAQAWQPGNRGIDYRPGPGTPVTAAADGTVVFAGPVAGTLHVTVAHPDGLRTSYSFLAEVSVVRGARLRTGDQLGVAGPTLHFGVRDARGDYLDPEALLEGRLAERPVLVPGTAEGADPLEERRHLLRVVWDAGVATVGAAAQVVPTMGEVGWWAFGTGAGYVRHRLDCTDPSRVPTAPEERRIAVVVSGLGTASTGNSAFALPTATLGYAPHDVVRFSYTGGRAPDPAHPHRPGAGLGGIPAGAFDGVDSQQPLLVSADRLADLLAEVARREPGVPVDVLAHSQGGVVARLALDRAATAEELPTEVRTLVTLGSPHQGADLAEGVAGLQATLAGDTLLHAGVEAGLMAPLDPRRPAIAELATGSTVLASVRDRPLPDHVRFTSIGARYDLTVPADRTADRAATHTTVVDPGVGFDAHGELTTDPAALREVGLAVAGLAPTCESFADHLADRLAPMVIGGAQRALGSTLVSVAEEGP